MAYSCCAIGFVANLLLIFHLLKAMDTVPLEIHDWKNTPVINKSLHYPGQNHEIHHVAPRCGDHGVDTAVKAAEGLEETVVAYPEVFWSTICWLGMGIIVVKWTAVVVNSAALWNWSSQRVQFLWNSG